MRPGHALLLAACLLAAGCDQLGIETPAVTAARREADAKAIGGACRHAGRAIEDCYVLNRKADKAAVFAGWREMDDYMRSNNLSAVAPVLPPPGLPKKPAKPASKPEDGEDTTSADAGGDASDHGDGGGGGASAHPAEAAPKH